MKPVLIKSNFTNEAYSHWCDGCQMEHRIIVKRNDKGPVWEFNGNHDSPTFSPSVLIRMGKDSKGKERVCHYFLKEGKIQYCGDCSHHLNNKTVDLPFFPEDYLDEEDLQQVVSYRKI